MQARTCCACSGLSDPCATFPPHLCDRAGSKVLDAGEFVGVAEVGILATVGATHVQVYSRPHVAVLSTGEGGVGEREAVSGQGRAGVTKRTFRGATLGLG